MASPDGVVRATQVGDTQMFTGKNETGAIKVF